MGPIDRKWTLMTESQRLHAANQGYNDVKASACSERQPKQLMSSADEHQSYFYPQPLIHFRLVSFEPQDGKQKPTHQSLEDRWSTT